MYFSTLSLFSFPPPPPHISFELYTGLTVYENRIVWESMFILKETTAVVNWYDTRLILAFMKAAKSTNGVKTAVYLCNEEWIYLKYELV
jgi:hypothetical protein